jgi:Na+-transporting methylmalonyl-CoA/oxaloacetate decarboxylase gamma subunit
MQSLNVILLSILLLVAPGMAQFFNFFGNQQPQEPQNMASDSQWYQQNYENGENDQQVLKASQAHDPTG